MNTYTGAVLVWFMGYNSTTPERKLKTVEDIDDKLQDLIQLYRLMWPNFNSIGPVDKVVQLLHQAYNANGQVADAIDKGWVK